MQGLLSLVYDNQPIFSMQEDSPCFDHLYSTSLKQQLKQQLTSLFLCRILSGPMRSSWWCHNLWILFAFFICIPVYDIFMAALFLLVLQLTLVLCFQPLTVITFELQVAIAN